MATKVDTTAIKFNQALIVAQLEKQLRPGDEAPRSAVDRSDWLNARSTRTG